MERPRRRPIAETAVALVARHGARVMATARRYAATAEDAEDAYQRGIEILLTRAPTTNEHQLVPWLKIVVRQQALRTLAFQERLSHKAISETLLRARGNGHQSC